jgi:ribosome-associated protein YbcJ (S4-like RNA binding protein)
MFIDELEGRSHDLFKGTSHVIYLKELLRVIKFVSAGASAKK